MLQASIVANHGLEPFRFDIVLDCLDQVAKFTFLLNQARFDLHELLYLVSLLL